MQVEVGKMVYHAIQQLGFFQIFYGLTKFKLIKDGTNVFAELADVVF